MAKNFDALFIKNDPDKIVDFLRDAIIEDKLADESREMLLGDWFHVRMTQVNGAPQLVMCDENGNITYDENGNMVPVIIDGDKLLLIAIKSGGDVDFSRKSQKENGFPDFSHVIIDNNFICRGYQDTPPEPQLIPFAVSGVFDCSGSSALFAPGANIRLPITTIMNATRAITSLDQLIDKLPQELRELVVDEKFVKQVSLSRKGNEDLLKSAKAFFEFYKDAINSGHLIVHDGRGHELKDSLEAISAEQAPVVEKPQESPKQEVAPQATADEFPQKDANDMDINDATERLKKETLYKRIKDNRAKLLESLPSLKKKTKQDAERILKEVVTHIYEVIDEDKEHPGHIVTKTRLNPDGTKTPVKCLKTSDYPDVVKRATQYIDDFLNRDEPQEQFGATLWEKPSDTEQNPEEKKEEAKPNVKPTPATTARLKTDCKILKYISRDFLSELSREEQEDVRNTIQLFNVYDQPNFHSTAVYVDQDGNEKPLPRLKTKTKNVFVWGRIGKGANKRIVFKSTPLTDDQGNIVKDENGKPIHVLVSCKYYANHDTPKVQKEYKSYVSDTSITVSTGGIHDPAHDKYLSSKLDNSADYEKYEYPEPKTKKQEKSKPNDDTPHDLTSVVTKAMTQEDTAGAFQPVNLVEQPEQKTIVKETPVAVAEQPAPAPRPVKPIKVEKPKPITIKTFVKPNVKDSTMIDYEIAKKIANIKLDQETDPQTLFDLLFNFEYMVPLLHNVPNWLLSWARKQTGTANAGNTESVVPFVHCVHLLVGAIILSTPKDKIPQHITNILTAMNTEKLNNFSEFISTVMKIPFNLDLDFTPQLEALDKDIKRARETNDKKINSLYLRRAIIDKMREMHEHNVLRDMSIPNFLKDLDVRVAAEQGIRPENKHFTIDDVVAKVKSEYGDGFDEEVARKYIETYSDVSLVDKVKVIIGQSTFDNLVRACIARLNEVKKQEKQTDVLYTKTTEYVSAKHAVNILNDVFGTVLAPTAKELYGYIDKVKRYLRECNDDRDIYDYISKPKPNSFHMFKADKLKEFWDIIQEMEMAQSLKSFQPVAEQQPTQPAEELWKMDELESRTMSELNLDKQQKYISIYRTRSTEEDSRWFTYPAGPHRRFRAALFGEFLEWFREKMTQQQTEINTTEKPVKTPKPQPIKEGAKSERGLVYIIGLDHQVNMMVKWLQSELATANKRVEAAKKKSEDAKQLAQAAKQEYERADAMVADLRGKISGAVNWTPEDIMKLATEIGTAETKQAQAKPQMEQAERRATETATELDRATRERDSIKKRFDAASSIIIQRKNAVSEKAFLERMVATKEQDIQKLNEDIIKMLSETDYEIP